MNILLEIIHITLLSIARAVFNLTFIIVLFIVYFLIKKIQLANVYSLENAKAPLVHLLEVALQGTIVGVLGSFIIILIGLPIHFTMYLALLLPISLLLSLINIRYICFSYSASIIGLLALILNGQTIFNITLPDLQINITGLIALVGILHMMESLLIFFSGANDQIPIISKKNNQIIQGHIMQKYWPIPIALLFVASGTASGGVIQMPDWWPLLKSPEYIGMPIYYGLMSLVGALGYSSVTFTEEPQVRSKKIAKMLFSYSLLILSIAILAKDKIWLHLLGLLIMAFMHEGIIVYERWQESVKKPIYTLPQKGIRIMYTHEGGIGEEIGLQTGDIIKKVNDIEIADKAHFREVMAKRFTYLWIEIQNLKNEIKVIEYKAYPNGIDNLGIKILPSNPKILFKYDQLGNIGIYHLIKKRLHKK